MHHFRFVRLIHILVVASFCVSVSVRAGVREFAEGYCFDCHDTSTHKAGLDLETLDLSIATKKNALT